MSRVFRMLSALAVLAVLAACTSSRTSVTTSSASVPPKLGAEVIKAPATSPDATSVTVRASGVFTDTGTLKLPIGNPRTITLRFAHGSLTVLNATGPTKGPLHFNNVSCAFSRSSDGTYRVLAGSSTGSYAGATGHGTYVLNSSGTTPKTSSGTCNRGSRAAPAKALFTILFRGPLVLNKQN